MIDVMGMPIRPPVRGVYIPQTHTGERKVRKTDEPPAEHVRFPGTFDMSLAVYKRLRRAGVITVGDLLDLSRAKLLGLGIPERDVDDLIRAIGREL